jgi:hypothetical protein
LRREFPAFPDQSGLQFLDRSLLQRPENQGFEVFTPMVATVADFGWVQMEVLLDASRTYASPPADVLGLAVDWPSLSEQSSDPAALAPLAASLHRDPVVTSILQALWAAAEVELLSDDSLREGADTIVRRPVIWPASLQRVPFVPFLPCWMTRCVCLRI